MAQPSLIRRIATHAVLCAVLVVTLYPILWVVKMAFSSSQGFALSAGLIPDEPTWANFSAVLMTQDAEGHYLFLHQLKNSLVVSLGAAVIGLAFSTSAAYALSRFRFPGRKGSMGVLLVTQMFPGVMMAIPIYILMEKLGLLDSFLGLMLVYSITSIPFSVFMLKGYFDTIPRELEEAAMIDGASQWTIYWRVILPLARPAVAVTGLFSFMTAWNEFILAATFLSDEIRFTAPVALQSYVGSYATEWGRFAAGALIVSIPVVLLFFALQRHLVGGLTSGSVKG